MNSFPDSSTLLSHLGPEHLLTKPISLSYPKPIVASMLAFHCNFTLI